MTRATRRLGFGLSLLAHAGLLGGLWLWQQHGATEQAVAEVVVPVPLSLFAAAVTARVTPPDLLPPEPALPQATDQAVNEPPVRAGSAERAPRPVEQPVKPVAATRPAPAAPAAVQQPPEQRQATPPVAERRPAASRPSSRQVPRQDRVAAARPPVAAPAPVAVPHATSQASLRSAYKAALLAAIERHKRYPGRARRRHLEGQVRVSFRVAADGRIGRIALVSGSGAALLDRAAVQTLQRLGRVAPLPPALGLGHWDLVVPIEFRLL